MKQHLVLWVPFVAVSVLTLLADAWLWDLPMYWLILIVLAGLSLFFAIRVIARTRPKLWPIAVVLAGLAIGQWWLIERAAAFAIWSIGGFAP